MKNFGLKLFCIVVAILLARFVHSRDNSSVVSVLVPLEIAGLPATKAIIWPLQRQVQITVQGPSFLLGKIAQSPPTMKIELPADIEYRYEAKLNDHALNISPALKVISIEPATMEFRLDEIVEKRVPVTVPQIGKVPENFSLDGIEANPIEVLLKGPKTELEGVSAIESSPLDLRGVVEPAAMELDLKAPGRISTVTPASVSVKVRVSVINVTKVVDSVPIEVRGPAGVSFKVAPETVQLTVQGTEERLAALNSQDLAAFIKANANLQSEQLRVEVETPPGISLVRSEPPKVLVTKGP